MTVYPPSTYAAVSVSDGEGGCGTTHSRPVVSGAPVKVWALDCDLCEQHLRKDKMWSTTPIDIRETYDEIQARERKEKSGKLDRENQLAEAMIELAKLGQLPEAIAAALAAVTTGAPALAGTPAVAGQMVCTSCGNGQPAGMKFCGECGAAMHSAPAKAAITAPAKAADATGGRPRRLRDARADELQALCRLNNLDDSGTRADLIARLSAAGVTSNDLAALSLVPA